LKILFLHLSSCISIWLNVVKKKTISILDNDSVPKM
jgi:hypothetical protein